ncbi:MAG TPA: carboxypeptidase-like regulatory domain-containing protein [Anaerolineae bacterium]
MSFNPQQYNTGFLNGDPAILARTPNAQDNYNIRLMEADVAEGETYWKVIGIHHLLPEENRGNHHVYMEALDENGQRIRPVAWADFTWEGRRPDEQAGPVQLDKPDNEPAGNIALHDGQKVTVWVRGLNRDGADKSDQVGNLDIVLPDEPGPSGELWNSIGHHSFYVVFQRTLKAGGATPAVSTGEVTGGQGAQGGVISGQVSGGQGYTVRLLQGDSVIAEQVTDSSGAFRFEGLAEGTYSVEASGPMLTTGPVQLDAGQSEVTVNLSA